MNKRQYERYIVEFPWRVAGDYEGTGNRIQPGRGGVQDRDGSPLTTWAMVAFSFNTPKQALSITVRIATVRRILQYEFGIEFLGMDEFQRGRPAHYLPHLAAGAA